MTGRCTREGCASRTFMDTDRCFDHQRGDTFIKAWMVFCALFGIAVLAVAVWAVIYIVSRLT